MRGRIVAEEGRKRGEGSGDDVILRFLTSDLPSCLHRMLRLIIHDIHQCLPELILFPIMPNVEVQAWNILERQNPYKQATRAPMWSSPG
jgi:hypothetical protein